jgi:hypothetical protein
MAETEVESILREIRERVLSQQRTGKNNTAIRSAATNGGYGAIDSLQQITNDDTEALIAENLSLIQSYLTTTARAWDRLPPLMSNRSGLIARVELWLKRQLKRATHWFTWEQVNFNASVHHALRDLLPLLSAHDAKLRRQSQHQAELNAGLIDLRTEVEAQRRTTETQSSQVTARFAGLVNEMRDRNERLQDEQRVCFKQLALENSEAAVLEDRARRKTEALLEELQRRVAELEKGK